MKRYLYAIIMVLMAIIPLTVHAEWYNEYTFVVGDGVSTPITVRCNGKSYKVYSSLTINFTGSTGSVSATDSYGNSLKYESSNKTVNKDTTLIITTPMSFTTEAAMDCPVQTAAQDTEEATVTIMITAVQGKPVRQSVMLYSPVVAA